MKIDRLISIIMILNNKERVTAKELSEKFEVSTKTIQRDIETIERAGIPIVSYKGHEGGYGIIESYRVDRASMTKNEIELLKNLLEGINETYKNEEVLSLINKFTAIEVNKGENRNNFIIDFSRWGKSGELTDKINILDNAIMKGRYIKFDYNNINGESSNRKIEPYKIIFKALNWYIYGYCTLKNEMRVFKVSRIRNLVLDGEFIYREVRTNNLFKEPEFETIEIIFRVKKEIRILLDDNFPTYEIINEDDKNITIKINTPYNNWVYSMILGFGDNIEVLEPKFLREKIISKIKAMNNLYK